MTHHTMPLFGFFFSFFFWQSPDLQELYKAFDLMNQFKYKESRELLGMYAYTHACANVALTTRYHQAACTLKVTLNTTLNITSSYHDANNITLS